MLNESDRTENVIAYASVRMTMADNETEPDNTENVIAYVGVDPIYQNYANPGEMPYPFSDDELDIAGQKGGLEPGEVFDGEEDEVEEEGDGDPSESNEKDPASVPPEVPVTAAVPAQRASKANPEAKK